MPRKKITIEEAYAVFEREGLKVKVESMIPETPKARLQDFLEDSEEVIPIAEPVGKKFIKVTLYASHSIGNGGETIVKPDGTKEVINNGIETFGPGIVTVPAHLATHLLHQDMLARQADERTYDRKLRSFAVFPQRTSYGVVSSARLVSTDSSFDIAAYVASLPSAYQV